MNNTELTSRPSLPEILILSIQHLLAMFIGNITPILIVVPVAFKTMGITDYSEITIYLIQGAMLSSAVATLIQLFPISLGKSFSIGSKLPVVMGASFGFMPVCISIASRYGLPGLFAAQIVGGLLTIPLGFLLGKVRKLFPNLVTGTVVLSIGLSLFPVAINYLGGGSGSTDFGSLSNLLLGFTTLSVILFLNQFTKGITKIGSIFIGAAFGYIMAILMGKVSFAEILSRPWFAMPRFASFGFRFELDAIIAMSIMYFITAIQMIGDLTATTQGGMNRAVTDKELSGGIIGNGFSAVVAALCNSVPTATFSQNVGIVTLTKVANRTVMFVTVIFLTIAAFIPKFAAIISAIPQPVLGGATITVFSLITMTGIKLIAQEDLSKSRNVIIVGLSLILGIGISQVGADKFWVAFPQGFRLVFGSSVVVATFVATLLNGILPD